MKKNGLLLAAAVLTVLTIANVDAIANPGVRIVGKQGWITIKSETKVGTQVLTPGEYYFSHEALGKNHYVSFQRVGDAGLAVEYSDEATVGPPIRVACRMETLPDTVKKTLSTAVSDGPEQRITRIEIKGENVSHEF
jgi:hypothetical protein